MQSVSTGQFRYQILTLLTVGSNCLFGLALFLIRSQWNRRLGGVTGIGQMPCFEMFWNSRFLPNETELVLSFRTSAFPSRTLYCARYKGLLHCLLYCYRGWLVSAPAYESWDVGSMPRADMLFCRFWRTVMIRCDDFKIFPRQAAIFFAIFPLFLASFSACLETGIWHFCCNFFVSGRKWASKYSN